MIDEIFKAIEVLKAGGIILYPTETVWGLGCDATNTDAVAKIYALKQREDQKAMIILVDKTDNAAKYVQDMPEIAWQLWDVSENPLTLILPEGRGVAKNALPEDNTIAIRVTSHKFCQGLIRRLGRPLISTSANITGKRPPQYFEDVAKEIKNGVDMVINPTFAEKLSGQPSSIIKVGHGSTIEVIR